MSEEDEPAEAPAFEYFRCPDCDFDFVLRLTRPRYCPLCAMDNRHDVVMLRRPATEADKPEGYDARERTT